MTINLDAFTLPTMEKMCVIDGNAIGLQWPSIVVGRAKKNNDFEEVREGGIYILNLSRAKVMCGSD